MRQTEAHIAEALTRYRHLLARFQASDPASAFAEGAATVLAMVVADLEAIASWEASEAAQRKAVR